MPTYNTLIDTTTGFVYATISSVGINGRGVKRESKALTVGGRAVTVGEDVTNQVEAPTK